MNDWVRVGEPTVGIGTPRRAETAVHAPSVELVQRSVVAAVQALLHVVLEQKFVLHRVCEAPIEQTHADQRARSNGVARHLQRHGVPMGRSACVPGGARHVQVCRA